MKKSLLFLIPALLFGGLLCYAVYNALAIYIPQQREQRDFAELRESVQASGSADSGTDADGTTVGTESGGPSGNQTGDQTGNGAQSGDGTGAGWANPYGALQERNGDFVGWLKIEDSEIDYPVMKSQEPEYYLHRDFDGNPSSSGCLFIGDGCDTDSDCFVIYGHKMNNNSMFGLLDLYAEYDYAVRHRKTGTNRKNVTRRKKRKPPDNSCWVS